MLYRSTSGLAPSRSLWLECRMRKFRKSLLLPESESLQKLSANIRGQIGFRARRCDLCNRPAHALPYRGCQKGVDVAGTRPAEHYCHARDLSALVDLVRHDWEEIGTGGKQGVQVGHHVVLPDEGMGPVELGVQGASHHLAPVVDAGGEGGSISRRSEEVCDCAVCAVLPNRGIEGCAVRTADLPNNLAPVVDAQGDSASSEVKKRKDNAVFPRYAVKRCGAGSRVAYGLAVIVDPKCEPIWIATHQRKSLGFASFPPHRQRNPIICCARGA